MPGVLEGLALYVGTAVGSATAGAVIVYGGTALALGYTAYNTAMTKAKRAEQKARAQARNRAQEIQNMQLGTVAPRRYIYGETITNGHCVFQETGGTGNKFLYRMVYLGEGPINDATELYFNDVNQTSYLNSASNLTSTTNAAAIVSGPYALYASAVVGLNGGAGATRSALNIVANTSWTSDCKMTGNAWLAYQLQHNNEVWTQGIPNIRVKVQGRKLYDPRLDGTVSGGSGTHRYNDETTWAYSNNSALCILDFLINAMKVDVDDIDLGSFQTAADTCDDNVTITDSSGSTTTEKRYTTNGVAFLDEEVISTLENLLIPCHGSLIEEGGTIRLLVPGETTTVTANLDEDDFVSELSIKVNAQISTRINTVGGTFTSATEDYQEVDFNPISSSSLIADDGREHIQEVSMSMVTSEAHAQRLASIILKENALTNSISVTLKPEFAYLRVGDIVTVTFQPEVTGGTGTDSILTTATKFQIISYNLQQNGEVSVELQEYADASYTWDTADHNYVVRTALADSFIDTIPAPTLGTPSRENFLDETGAQVLAMRIPITHGSHPNFAYTQIKLVKIQFTSGNVTRNASDFQSFDIGADAGSVLFSGMSVIPPIGSAAGDYIRYQVYAQTVTENGKRSSLSSISFQTIHTGGYIQKDTTAPPTPNQPTVTAGVKNLVIDFSNYTKPDDFNLMKIVEVTQGGDVVVGTSLGTSFVHAGLTQNTTHTYKLIAVDKVGNESSAGLTAQGTVAADVQGPQGPSGQSGLVVTLNGADMLINNSDPQANTSANQALFDAAFLQNNPGLSAMSEIPDDVYVWARFINNTNTSVHTNNNLTVGTRYIIASLGVGVDWHGLGLSAKIYPAIGVEFEASVTYVSQGTGGEVTTASTRRWLYSTQDWTDHAETFDTPAIFSPTVFSNEILTNLLSSQVVQASQLIVNSDVDLQDGAAWRVGKETYSDTADGLFFGNPAGTGTGNHAFAFTATSNSGTASEHGLEITPDLTKLIQPTIVKTQQGALTSAQTPTSQSSIHLQSTQPATTLKSTTLNPNAQSITINAIGGGGGGAGADGQTSSATGGGTTTYVLAITGGSNAGSYTVNALGGAAGTGYGADKWRGDGGASSSYASGGAGGGSQDAVGTGGSLGSGGGGGAGRPPDWNQSSKKGGAGGGAATVVQNTYDISGATSVTLAISSIGSGGNGGSSTRGNGGAGGTGSVNYTIQTEGLEPVILNTESEYKEGTIGRYQSWQSLSIAANTWTANPDDQPVQVMVSRIVSGGGTMSFFVADNTSGTNAVTVSYAGDVNHWINNGGVIVPKGKSFMFNASGNIMATILRT